MGDIQGWFEPLLWIFGTITTLVAFCRLCKPIWTFIQSPKALAKSIEKLDEKLEAGFSRFNTDIQEVKDELKKMKDKDEVNDCGTVALLRDRILQMHRYLITRECITQEEFETVNGLFIVYKRLGGNHFVDKLMDEINKMKIVVTQE